eukprot:scaffold17559_cov110-Isochrysis_galbana.AAC.8
MSSEDGEPPATTLPLDKSKEGLTKASEKYSKARTVAEEIVGQWASVRACGPTPCPRPLPHSFVLCPCAPSGMGGRHE